MPLIEGVAERSTQLNNWFGEAHDGHWSRSGREPRRPRKSGTSCGGAGVDAAIGMRAVAPCWEPPTAGAGRRPMTDEGCIKQVTVTKSAYLPITP